MKQETKDALLDAWDDVYFHLREYGIIYFIAGILLIPLTIPYWPVPEPFGDTITITDTITIETTGQIHNATGKQYFIR